LNSRSLFVYRFISARHNGASASAHRTNFTDASRDAASVARVIETIPIAKTASYPSRSCFGMNPFRDVQNQKTERVMKLVSVKVAPSAMIRKSGNRFSEKIMFKQKKERDDHSKISHPAPGNTKMPFRISPEGHSHSTM
jgi:hypothetical protein